MKLFYEQINDDDDDDDDDIHTYIQINLYSAKIV